MSDHHDHYQNRVTIDADRERVFAALTTREGIEGWWGFTCTGDFGVGSRFDVTFGSDGHSVMEVTHVEPNAEVRWACIESTESDATDAAPDEWVGTTLIWRLSPAANGGAAASTELGLEHIGLTPVLQCFAECNDIWNRLLPGSLKPYVETGKGRPAKAA